MSVAMTVLQQELLPEGLNISFKILPAIIVTVMMLSFLGVGYLYKVADTGNMWVAGRSIGNVENGMAIGSNWMSAASYLGMAALIALSGVYGLAYVVGWTTGYFILLIFLAAQMRRFGKYTAPDFVGDRFNSDTARALAAVTTFLIGFVYALGQARGMGLVGMYIFGDITTVLPLGGLSAYQAMMILFMIVTIGYLALSGMLGATKNMVLQYIILISAFLIGLLVTGWSAGFSTILPQIEYGALITELSAEFSAPFEGGSYYLWVATAFSLVFGTCGLPHVLVRFYTVQNERVARWSCTWGLFFICLLYLSAPAFAAFGTALYADEIGAVYGDPGMSGAAADVIVVLASQLAGLPSWLVGLVAAGGIAAALRARSTATHRGAGRLRLLAGRDRAVPDVLPRAVVGERQPTGRARRDGLGARPLVHPDAQRGQLRDRQRRRRLGDRDPRHVDAGGRLRTRRHAVGLPRRDRRLGGHRRAAGRHEDDGQTVPQPRSDAEGQDGCRCRRRKDRQRPTR